MRGSGRGEEPGCGRGEEHQLLLVSDGRVVPRLGSRGHDGDGQARGGVVLVLHVEGLLELRVRCDEPNRGGGSLEVAVG